MSIEICSFSFFIFVKTIDFMIKEYLTKISTDLSRYNQTLSKTSILIDKPWALIDDNNEVQKLIFKKNNDLILSKNGKAEIGKWEYFPEAKSLLIDRGTDKIFCNEIFIDKGVIILKLDGTKHDFFALANENIVADLDVIKYLNTFVKENIAIEPVKVYFLEDGSKVEIHSEVLLPDISDKNVLITINNNNVNDGFYKIKGSRLTLIVKNSRVVSTRHQINYTLDDGIVLAVLQKLLYDVSVNDYVLINNSLVGNETYFLHKNKKIITKNGLIEKVLIRPNILNISIGDFREV